MGTLVQEFTREPHGRRILKRTLRGITALATLVTMAGSVYAQRNPRGKARLNLQGRLVTVEYGRPSLRGRTVYEMLSKLPADGVWRLGADTSTTFSTDGDLMFGDTKIPRGVYSLWARKDTHGAWKLVFNSEHGQSGTRRNSKLDFAEVPMKTSRAADPPDEVTIWLTKNKTGGMIAIEWGDLRLYTEFN